MSLNDLQKKAHKVMYRPKQSLTLQRWNTNARQLKDEFGAFNKLIDNYLGLNRPVILN